MANWYVSPTGDDTTGDGSSGNPWKHIHKAIDSSSSGDTIICKDGTYDEEIGRSILFPLVIKSESGDYRDVIVKPYTLANYSSRSWLQSAATNSITLEDISVNFDKNHFSVPTAVAFIVESRLSDVAVSATAIGCHFYSSNWVGSEVTGAFYCGVFTGFSIYKCTIVGYFYYGVGLWQTATITVRDSIISGCFIGLDNTGLGATIDSDYNDFYNNTTDITSGSIGANSITSDPAFTSGVEINSSSPCYDAGVIVSGYVDTYSGDAPDIGCYEIEPKILLYTGEYNDGSSSGTVNLSERVLTIGQISEVLMGGVNRPWVQQTSVTIDDSDGYFLGTLSKGTEWYNGTFDIWGEHGTAWEHLLTGFVPTAAWSYNYGEQTATINVTSMLLRASTVSMGYGGSVYTPLGYSSEFRSPVFFHNGTITDIDTDGTVTVEYFKAASAPWPWQLGALCWTEADTTGTINQEAFAPAPINSVGSWEGTAVGASDKKYLSRITFLGGTKDWMSVGRSIVPTVPWPASVGFPSQTTSIIDLLDVAVGSMGLTWDSTSKTKFESDLLIVPATLSFYNGTEVLTGAPLSNGVVPRYFGGQPWVNVVNDIMESVGANWTVSGIGEVHARIKRASALESVTGTIDFDDSRRYINEQWVFTESEGLSSARVYHEWDDIEQRFDGSAVTDGSFDSGAMLSQNAKWQRDLGGKLLANRILTWEKPISRLFPLPFPKEMWGSLIPGSVINLINIPATIQPNYGSGFAPLIAEGKYAVTARHYDYMEESMTADLRQSPPLTGVFILDHSHLDGTDKLY